MRWSYFSKRNPRSRLLFQTFDANFQRFVADRRIVVGNALITTDARGINFAMAEERRPRTRNRCNDLRGIVLRGWSLFLRRVRTRKWTIRWSSDRSSGVMQRVNSACTTRVRENDTCASKKGGARNDGGCTRRFDRARHVDLFRWNYVDDLDPGSSRKHAAIVPVVGVDRPQRIEGKINNVSSP